MDRVWRPHAVLQVLFFGLIGLSIWQGVLEVTEPEPQWASLVIDVIAAVAFARLATARVVAFSEGVTIANPFMVRPTRVPWTDVAGVEAKGRGVAVRLRSGRRIPLGAVNLSRLRAGGDLVAEVEAEFRRVRG